ncbi:MAG: hypothetical protein J1F36_03880 [Clostridiales bacterium]|nr:hypothetical protein [Clostridiales bacterium]
MDRKNGKSGYYSELIKKSGLIVPVFGALAMFAVLFYVRFVGMFKNLNEQSPIAYWLLIVCALISIVLTIAYIASKLKCKEIGAQDTLLLTFDFLMVFLLLGMIIFNIASLDTLYYAVALIALIVLNILRAKFAQPTYYAVKRVLQANISVKKYFEVVVGRFGFWKLAVAALLTLCALVVSHIQGFPELFLSEVAYTVGLLLVGAVVMVSLIISAVTRLASRTVNSLDAFVMYAFFTNIVSVIAILYDFTVLKLALWLFALIVVFTFICILGLNTRIDEDATDASFFATDGGKKFVKGPKVYFKSFFKSFNIIALCAVALITFAAMNALVATNFLSWASENKFMLYAALGILLFGIIGIAYLAKTLKNTKIGMNDAVLWILDVALLLLAITIFANYGSSIIVSLIIWAIFFVICVAFTIARLFKVREVVEEEQNIKE